MAHIADSDIELRYLDLFTQEHQIGMLYGLAGHLPYYVDDLGDQIGIVSLPRFEGRDPVHTFQLTGLGITKETLNPDLAWRFIRELLIDNHELSQQMAQESFVSTRKSVTMESGIGEHKLASVMLDLLENAQISFLFNEIGSIEQWYGSPPRILEGIPPEMVLRQMAREWDQLLEQVSNGVD